MDEQLQAELTAAVATILEKHGFHWADANETEGWTVDMSQDFADLMGNQIEQILASQRKRGGA